MSAQPIDYDWQAEAAAAALAVIDTFVEAAEEEVARRRTQGGVRLTTRPDLTSAWSFLQDPVSADTSWMEWADCVGVDPDLWFPRPNVKAQEAKTICQSCAVRVECLDFSLRSETEDGVWGGLSSRARRKLRGEVKRQGLALTADDLEVLIEAHDAGRLAEYLGPADLDAEPDDLAVGWFDEEATA